MSLWCVCLFFTDRVHFGRLGVGLESVEEVLHADSLYSALCHAWSARFGSDDLTGLLERFQQEPPFLFSSAFPFLNDTFFLPKPMTPPPGFERTEIRLEHGKEVKQIDYLTREQFSAWVHGGKFPFAELAETMTQLRQVFHKDLIPRVALGRENNRSEIFHVGVLRFAQNAGLYFLVRFADEALLPQFRAALSLLGEMGLGGERAYGLGRFTVHLDRADSSWNFLEKNTGSRFISLAPFCPPVSDLTLVNRACSYGLIERKGWIHSPFTYQQLKRKTGVMFTVGSVFTDRIRGQVLNVTPRDWDVTSSHPIFRFALPFFVPVQ